MERGGPGSKREKTEEMIFFYFHFCLPTFFKVLVILNAPFIYIPTPLLLFVSDFICGKAVHHHIGCLSSALQVVTVVASSKYTVERRMACL